MARGDRLNTFLTGNSSLHQLAFWLCGDTRPRLMCVPDKQPGRPFIWRDAAWQCEGKSHLAEQFPHTAWSFRFILPAEMILGEIASLLELYSLAAYCVTDLV